MGASACSEERISLLIGLYLLVFNVMRATERVGYHCHLANVRLTPLLFAFWMLIGHLLILDFLLDPQAMLA
jgi:hypothetical protein